MTARVKPSLLVCCSLGTGALGAAALPELGATEN